ncbi:MAG TPA: DNA polymerase [Ilumatobacteraceae bacterium]|nr:DNA polymerase [Ilumatobacteraceae bacterium]
MDPPPSDFAANEAVALAVDSELGVVAVGEHGGETRWAPATAPAGIGHVERSVGPRWVWWTPDTPRLLVAAGVRPARCWDLDAVHRLVHGGWRAGPALTWAGAHGLDTEHLPTVAPVDLFSAAQQPTDVDDAVRSDGHLDPTWADGAWRGDLDSLARWATLALDVYRLQRAQLDELDDRPAAPATARSESAAALLAVELGHDGLPIDLAEAERIVGSFIGPRPTDAADERRAADERDGLVLAHLPADLRGGVDLRNPANVKSLLRRAGIEVDDTRAWRLERLRNEHPVVDALLAWRKAERVATTFGYRWLDEHVDADGRLRGTWASSDGAAGRMTATAGLHNLPADLRPAVVAEPGHSFVRADLGQIEPRILAAVSGDAALAEATHEADMYAPVAHRLGVTREIAKVAVLGAMYGQTTGHGAAALRGLDAAYPVAMRYLTDAARAAESGLDLRTRGGRQIRMSDGGDPDADERDQRSRAAARGRYGRNAMVQGAAAEFFKTWAVIVRARIPADSQIVLCLHDELLVHTRSAADVAAIVDDAVQETAARWQQPELRNDVRFVVDTSVIARWSDAK